MSLGESYAKYPDPGTRSPGLPPSPTIENPGGVFPRSDPQAASPNSIPGGRQQHSGSPAYLGNPFLMNRAFNKLDSALGEIIQLIESEEMAVGNGEQESDVLRKLRTWRDELDGIRGIDKSYASSRSPSRSRTRLQISEGGIFAD